jgi:hypothetical protein
MKKTENLWIQPYDISWYELCNMIKEKFPKKDYDRKNIIISQRKGGIWVKGERKPEV